MLKFTFLKLTCASLGMPPTPLSWMSQAAKWNMPGLPFQPLDLADNSGIELRLNPPPVWVWGAELGLFLGVFGSVFTLQPAEDLLLRGSKRRTKNKRGKEKKKGGGEKRKWHLALAGGGRIRRKIIYLQIHRGSTGTAGL